MNSPAVAMAKHVSVAAKHTRSNFLTRAMRCCCSVADPERLHSGDKLYSNVRQKPTASDRDSAQKPCVDNGGRNWSKRKKEKRDSSTNTCPVCRSMSGVQ